MGLACNSFSNTRTNIPKKLTPKGRKIINPGCIDNSITNLSLLVETLTAL
jgi:hypothetical protein